jgi:hypothetical protein
MTRDTHATIEVFFDYNNGNKYYKQGQSCSGVDSWQLRDIRRTRRPSGRETEESPLLEAVAREPLLKTMRAGEDLVFAAVTSKFWRAAITL